jgi:hypothetical protein
MRKLITVTVVAVAMAVASAAQATPNASKKAEVQFQKQRYYHALGYYKAIWNVAGRTVYSPNLRIRRKWLGAVRYLKRIQVNSLNEIHRLTAPPVTYLDASNPSINYTIVAPLIYQVFGSRGAEAVSVSGCETGHKYNTNASNGQYKGLFQMGDSERATYGDARDALGEILAAHRYFVASGSDWSPWECKP